MKTFFRMTLPALALLASVAVAQAQPAPVPTPTPAPAPGATMPMQGMGGQGMQGMAGPGMQGMPMTGAQGGMSMGCPMMGQAHGSGSGGMGMMPMMQMMGQDGGMGMGMGMGMPFEHVNGRIAFLETEIGITDAQRGQWNAFAAALRRNAETHRTIHQEMMGPSTSASLNWPERLQRRVQMMSTRTDALKAVEAAAGPLYQVLSEDQRQKAEKLLSGPMGMI
jgi:hypothetical protein